MVKYFGKFKKIFLIVIIAVGGTIGGQTLQTVFFSHILDGVISFNVRKVITWFFFNALITIFTILLGQFAEIKQEQLTQRIDTEIRDELANGIGNLDYSKISNKTVGEYTSWFTNDIEQINSKGVSASVNIIMYGFGILWPLISLGIYHWSLALCGVICALIEFYIPRLISPLVTKATRNVSAQNEKLNGTVQNVLENLELLFSFHRKSLISKMIHKESLEVLKVNVDHQVAASYAAILNAFVSVFCQFVIMGLTAFLAYHKYISLGTFYATGSLAGILMASFSQIGNHIVNLKSVTAITEKYNNLDISELEDVVLENKPVSINAEGVTVGEGNRTWLPETTLNVNPGDKVYLEGPSGTGKSTLLKVISGLVVPTAGNIAYSSAQAAARILYVPQTTYIMNGSLRFNLTLGLEISDAQIWEILKLVNLEKTVRQLNKGLDTEISELSGMLSGGERQRIGIVRALLANSGVLLLDEVTANVDDFNSKEIMEHILNDPELTVVFSNHNKGLIEALEQRGIRIHQMAV